ncbi:MAG: hypothetical protein JSV80_06455 [Acidobacteriota bacterium]|nr:MAG: hypothetical protein JSV80_06455 [Acidobacteriota bacterium]
MSTTQIEDPSARTETATPPQQVPPEAMPVQRPRRIRRRYLVDARGQLRSSLLSIGVVALLLVFANVALMQLYMSSSAPIADLAPELHSSLMARDRLRITYAVIGSAVFLLGFAALRIIESHKTHGAAYNLSRRLEEIASGRFDVRTHLRATDDLQQLAERVNEVAASLRESARRDAEDLEYCAASAAASGADPELVTRLEDLARAKRRSAS